MIPIMDLMRLLRLRVEALDMAYAPIDGVRLGNLGLGGRGVAS